MSDNSPFLFEPIVQGVVTFEGGEPVWNGEGISAIERFAGFPVGAFLLTLDEGLIGNAGAVPPGANPLIDNNVRTMVQTRGLLPVPTPNIITIAVVYLTSLAPGVGANQIGVIMQTSPLALADPTGGFEMIVWRSE
jgi:hypothetical protein